MANSWFKFYGQEWLTDMKIESLTLAERAILLTLFCLAHSEGKDGFIPFFTEERLLIKSGVSTNDAEWAMLQGVTQKLQDLKIIEKCPNGIIVLNFKKRQEINLTGAERVAKHREKKAFVTDVTSDVTSNVTNVTLDKIRIDKTRQDIIEAQAPTKSVDELWTTLIDPFRNSLAPSMLVDFENHWRAKNQNGKKERWQMEKVFDMTRRLATWKRNDQKWQYEKEAHRIVKQINERPIHREDTKKNSNTGFSSIGNLLKK